MAKNPDVPLRYHLATNFIRLLDSKVMSRANTMRTWSILPLGFFLCCVCEYSQATLDLDPLWLRYEPISDLELLSHYQNEITRVHVVGDATVIASLTSKKQLETVANELERALTQLLSRHTVTTCCDSLSFSSNSSQNNVKALHVLVGESLIQNKTVKTSVGSEGFHIGRTVQNQTLLMALTPSAALHGVFRLVSHLQKGEWLPAALTDAPSMKLR